MVPFYFLKCEYLDIGTQIYNATCDVRVYGKDNNGGTIVVVLHNYQPDFFVSFSERNVCMRIVKNIRERLERYAGSLCNNAGTKKRVRAPHIKGLEMANGYNSLIIYKDHQNNGGSVNYGDTPLSFTYRIYVRCFSHIRPAIKELLEIARNTAVEMGDYTGVSQLERDVHFYDSSLDAKIRIADRLKLRPCQWCLLDTSCSSTSKENGVQVYTYDYMNHVNADVLKKEGRLVFDKMPPFSELIEKEQQPQPPPPPVSVLSFDIECLANDVKVFPTPDVCRIIQIATVTAKDAINRSEYHYSEPYKRCLYTLKNCDPVGENIEVRCYDEERDMLAAFCTDVVAEDPDIISGYYIENFDLPFLFARLAYHGLSPVLGRLGLVSTCEKNANVGKSSKRFTSYIPKSHFTTIHGRTVFDACVYIRKEFALRSYSLNAVSDHFLKSRKDDVHYTEIPSLFEGGPQSRAVLGRYCVKDAQLVVDLIFNLQTFVHMYERCKVFNTTLEYMVDRGQQVRIQSMLLKWCSVRMTLINDCTTPAKVFYDTINKDMRQRLYEYNAIQESLSQNCAQQHEETAPSLSTTRKRKRRKEDDDDDDDKAVGEKDTGGKSKNTGYDGAVVIDPIRGLYYDPVLCLDYASLYPSIMIAYNICYSTMVLNIKHGHELVNSGQAACSPVGHYFLKSEVKKGVLPSILETLISTRSDVRKRMADLDRSSIDYILLDGQQGALKIAANSIYGATGCQRGNLYFLHIPSSVTAYGRQMLTTTKEFIEHNYRDRVVVYGDTDSVMVRLVGWTKHLWECTDEGTEMADSVTRLINKHPIRLQFETVYRPFLLANKKRYAAGVYKSLDKVNIVARSEGVTKAQRMLEATDIEVNCKGLEVVRRDNCVFTKNTLQKTVNMMIVDMIPPEAIVDALRKDIRRLLDGDINVRDLIISKAWTKKTKNPTPHDRLAQKMAERNPGEAPKLGDRIQYIVIKSHGKIKMCDRAEDPLYVLEHGLDVDYVYYADNQLLNPLTNVLSIAMPDLSREEIKDLLWPHAAAADTVPERPSKIKKKSTIVRKRNTKHDVIPYNNRQITSYFSKTGVTNIDEQKNKEEKKGLEIKDIEDVCSRLLIECRICKKGDDAAITTCKNRDCSLLYDRYTQMRRIKNNDVPVGDKEYVKVLGLK